MRYPLKILTLLFFFIINLQAEEKLVVGYYSAWSRYSYPAESVDFQKVTHLIHAFVWPKSDGTLDTYSSMNYPALIQRAHDNDTKVLVAIGGWGNCDYFSPLLADSVSRNGFIDNLVQFCLDRGYDGVDIDWEYPGSNQDKKNLVTFVKELDQKLKANLGEALVTMAVPAGAWSGSKYNYESMTPYIKWFGCMSYDFHGSWTNHAGHNAPLYAPSFETDGSVSSAMDYLFSRNIPAEKIVMGLPFYGRHFNTSGLYQSATGGSGMAYNEIVNKIGNGWERKWDDLAKVPYLVNDAKTELITYDDTASVRIKCDYVNGNSLAGVMIWTIDQDHINGTQPLLETINNTFKQTSSITNNNIQQAVDFSVENPYPNPFNSCFSLKLQINRKMSITINTYDLNGRIVKELFKGNMNSSQPHFTFDMSGLGSGIYFLSVESSAQRVVKKINYLK